MPIVVQKFGGTSVSENGLPHLLEIVENTPYPLVVVVSAEKGVTNRLLEEAKSQGLSPQATDALLTNGENESVKKVSEALLARGKKVRAFTNKTIGIKTDNSNGNAKLITVQPQAILEALATHSIAVVAGFQGMDAFHQPTTLGRGGSDLTALALASALKSKTCEIYTDVCGVYTGNPSQVVDAKQFSTLNSTLLEEMARLGSQVMQLRSMSFAKRCRLSFSVKSTWEKNCQGTKVTCNTPIEAAITADNHSHWVEIPKNQFIKHLQGKDFMIYNSLQLDIMATTPQSIRCTVPKNHLDELKQLVDVRELCAIAKISYVGEMTPKTQSFIHELVGPYPILEEAVGLLRYTLIAPLEMSSWLVNFLHEACIEQKTSPCLTIHAA